MKKIKLLAAIIAISSFNMAYAATASAPMQVTATVEAKCGIITPNINFGTIQLGTASITPPPSMLIVECTKGTAFSVAFNGGLNAGGGTIRKLKHATLNEYLEYMIISGGPILFNQPAITGNGNGLGSMNITPFPIFAIIDTNANVTPGSYSDTVTVTVTY